MQPPTTSSFSERSGRSIDGVGLRVETWTDKLTDTTSGEQRNAVTRIRVCLPLTQISKNLLTHLIITSVITLSLYLALTRLLTDLWFVSVLIGLLYAFQYLTSTVLYEEVFVVHGKVLQTSTKFLCWPLRYNVYVCEDIELVCINEGFRRERVIFYLMIVTTRRERQRECKVLFENILPGLDVIKGMLDELRGAVLTSESME